jgi:hypothetical protein
MKRKTDTILLLLAAAVLMAAMVWYHFRMARKDIDLLMDKTGVVTAIVYNEENSSAVIGDKIVHQGDIINGVKVVGIYRDRVEFDKDGTKWAQKIRERPAKGWR